MGRIHRGRAVGPHPGITTAAALTVAVAGTVVLAPGTHHLLDPAALLPAPALGSAGATVSGFLTLGSAVPLLVAAATFAARQQRLGIRVPGPVIGLAGGIAAALLLALVGMLTWTVGMLGDADAGDGRALTILAAAAGVGVTMASGLFAAGVAVPCLVLRLTPRWLASAGIVLAALAELSWFSLVLSPAAVLLPVARWGTLLWLVVAGFLLPRDRREVRPEAGRADAQRA